MQPAQQTGTAVLCCCCAVLLLCNTASVDTGSGSKTAVLLSQAAERATVRTQLVLLSSFAYGYTHIYLYMCVQRTLFLPLLSYGAKSYAVFLRFYRSHHTISMYYGPGMKYWCKKSFVHVQSSAKYALGVTYTYQRSNMAPGTRYDQACF